MVNRAAGCQPPTGATPLLTFGLPSLPGVVGMMLAPGSALGKHPFCVVCGCGPGCRVCGGCGVGIGVWGCGFLVMLCMRALFVGGGGCVWVPSSPPVIWLQTQCLATQWRQWALSDRYSGWMGRCA